MSLFDNDDAPIIVFFLCGAVIFLALIIGSFASDQAARNHAEKMAALGYVQRCNKDRHWECEWQPASEAAKASTKEH